MSGSIYTADAVAQELFGYPDAGDFSNQELNLVDSAIASAERAVCAFLRRSITFTEHTTVITVEDDLLTNPMLPALHILEPRRAISLPNVPVQATGLQVSISSRNQNSWELLTVDEDYQLDNVVDGLSFTGVIRRLGGGTWPTAPGGVKVTYTGGLDVVQSPGDWDALKQGTLAAIRHEYAKGQLFKKVSENGGALEEEDIGEWRVKFDIERNASMLSTALPPEAIWHLQPLISYGEWL